MRADGEAVRLIAQALDIVENRVARLEHEGGAPRPVEMLAPRVTVRPLGNTSHGEVRQAQFVEHGFGGGKLALPTID